MSIPSTINEKRLAMLKIYEKPPTYHLQREPGNGCFLDPPGYPTYYTQSVYTQHGNSPRKGAETIIFGRVVHHSSDWNGVKDWNEMHARRSERLRRLWVALPIDHPRTKAWMGALFRHFRSCYKSLTEMEYGKPKTVIYPVPEYELKTFRDDPRFSDEYRNLARAEVDQYNRDLIARRAKDATIDNHLAVVTIRRFYPEYVPTPEVETALLARQTPEGYDERGNWWETQDERPTPENCHPRNMGPHPLNVTRCQWCGWQADAN